MLLKEETHLKRTDLLSCFYHRQGYELSTTLLSHSMALLTILPFTTQKVVPTSLSTFSLTLMIRPFHFD